MDLGLNADISLYIQYHKAINIDSANAMAAVLLRKADPISIILQDTN